MLVSRPGQLAGAFFIAVAQFCQSLGLFTMVWLLETDEMHSLK